MDSSKEKGPEVEKLQKELEKYKKAIDFIKTCHLTEYIKDRLKRILDGI